ncbi:DUF397 domain-containing protein [Streptomyces mayteni]
MEDSNLVRWQKSSFSGTEPDNHCVELAAFGSGLVLREGETPETVLSATPLRLKALLDAISESANWPSGI